MRVCCTVSIHYSAVDGFFACLISFNDHVVVFLQTCRRSSRSSCCFLRSPDSDSFEVTVLWYPDRFFKLSVAPKLFSAIQATQLCWFLRHLVSVWNNLYTQGSAKLLDNWRNTSRNEDLWFRSLLNVFLSIPETNCKLYMRHVTCWMLWTLLKGLFPPSQWGIYLQIDTLSCILNRK